MRKAHGAYGSTHDSARLNDTLLCIYRRVPGMSQKNVRTPQSPEETKNRGTRQTDGWPPASPMLVKRPTFTIEAGFLLCTVFHI